MFNADTFDNFEEGMTQPYTIVSVAKMCETEKSSLGLPLRWRCLFNPMSGNCKVAIGVAGLPCIACQIDLASDGRTLERLRILNVYFKVCPYIEFRL
jgi:hypothetical protein